MTRAATAPAKPTAHTDRSRKGWTGGDGFLWLVFPAMLLLTALEVLLSGRDLTQSFVALEREVESIVQPLRHPLLAWVQRFVSLVLIAGCLERITSLFLQRKPLPSVLLTWSFVVYWFTSVALPAVFGAQQRLSHEYLYTLLLGLACTLATARERDRILDGVRNALFLFMLAGWALVPLQPTMVLDTSYTQGLLPGVPRFGGLAVHPVMLGMLAQTALVLLWARPYRRGWLNVSAWLAGLGVLFLAQSKTAWLAFLVCALAFYLVRSLPDTVQRAGDPRRGSFGVGLCLSVIGLVLAVLLGFLVMDLPGMVDDFFSSSQGAQLASLTGRDRIWVVALDEWSQHPVFGYGATLWDAEYRQAIQMPNATHAHNQLIDTLARSGSVGLAGLLLWVAVLTWLSLRSARATRGLSLALYLTLALLSISEVPLILFDYGSHAMTHYLLILTVASAAATRPRAARARVEPLEPTAFRTAA